MNSVRKATDDTSSTASSDYDEYRLKDDICRLRFTKDVEQQLAIVYYIKSCLSREPDATRKELVQLGIVPRFVDFLKMDENCALQFYSAWILTSLTDGADRYTQVVVESKAIPNLARLLFSEFEVVKNQALWTLGGIADTSFDFRNQVIDQGVLIPLLKILTNNTSEHTTKAATFCLSTLCRGTLPESCHVLPVLYKLMNHTNSEILMDACWGLLNFLDMVDDETKEARINGIICIGLCKRIVQLLKHPREETVHPAILLVGEITSANENQMHAMIDSSVLPKLLYVLQNRSPPFCRMACDAIVNISRGSRLQIQALIDAHVFPSLIAILDRPDSLMLTQATMAIRNATTKADPDQIQALVLAGCIQGLCNVLLHKNIKIAILVLQSLRNILQVGEDTKKPDTKNPYAAIVKKNKGWAKLKKLQHQKKRRVHKMANSILVNYFTHHKELSIVPNIRKTGVRI